MDMQFGYLYLVLVAFTGFGVALAAVSWWAGRK